MIYKSSFRILEFIIIALAFIRTGLLCDFDLLSIIIFTIGTIALFFDWFVLEEL